MIYQLLLWLSLLFFDKNNVLRVNKVKMPELLKEWESRAEVLIQTRPLDRHFISSLYHSGEWAAG